MAVKDDHIEISTDGHLDTIRVLQHSSLKVERLTLRDPIHIRVATAI